jgi:hypothetical protein
MEPGQENNIVLTKYEYKKESFPYSDCISNPYNSTRNAYVIETIRLENVYTQKRCIRFCAKKLNEEANKKRCSALNDSSYECLKSTRILTDYYESCAPECPLECDYSVFNVISTYTEYPSKNYVELLKQSKPFMSKFGLLPGNELDFDRVRDSVLKLNVYFSWVNVFYYEDEPVMDFNQFLSNIGLIY